MCSWLPLLRLCDEMSRQCALWRFALGLLTLDAAAGQTITGYVRSVGMPDGSTRPLAMKTAQLPATVVVVSNGYALSTMTVTSLNTAVLAGSPVQPGYFDALGGDARFGLISDLALTRSGQVVYVADELNSCIRQVNIQSSSGLGMVSTYVGTNVSGEDVGPLKSVRLTKPTSVVLSPDEMYLYVADRDTYRIVKVDISGGVASYVLIANWNYAPIGLTMGPEPTKLFVSTSTRGIFQLNLIASTATLLDTTARNGQCLCVAGGGNYLFVTDATWNAVRVIDLKFGGSRWICSPTNRPQPTNVQVFSDLETCTLGQPFGITAINTDLFYISDLTRANVTALTYSGNFALTTVQTLPPTTVTTPPAPTFAIPPVFTPKALSTTTTLPLSFAPISNSTGSSRASAAEGGDSLAVALGAGLGVALIVALACGLCVFFAVRDYRKNKRNPTTPFSRAVSFAVRSFRNSFGKGRFQRDGRQQLAESNGGLAGNGSAAAATATRFDDIRLADRPPAAVSAGQRQRPQQRGLPARAAARQPDGGSLSTSQQAAPTAAPAQRRAGREGSLDGSGGQQRFQPPTYEALGLRPDAVGEYESLKLKGLRPESVPPNGSAGGGRAPGRGEPAAYGGTPAASASYEARAASAASYSAQQRASEPSLLPQAATGQRYYADPLGAGGLYGQPSAAPTPAEARSASGPQRPSQVRYGGDGRADLAAASSYRSGGGGRAAAAGTGNGGGELILSPVGLAAGMPSRPTAANPAYGYQPQTPPAGGGGPTGRSGTGEPLGGGHSVHV